MSRFINLTPHLVRVYGPDGTTVIREFPSEGSVRVAEEIVREYEIDGIRITETRFGEAEGLPTLRENDFIIVSPPVMSAVHGRPDLVAPNTGPASVVRDDAGRIQGVRGLRKLV